MAGNGQADVLERHRQGYVEVLAIRVAEIYQAEVIHRIGQAARQAFTDADVSAFVFDLSDVTFLTSGALGLLIHLRSQLQDQGRVLAIAGATGDVARVIACTRLAEVMPMYPSVEAAVRDLAIPGP